MQKFLLTLFVFTAACGSIMAADSKRTAEYVLANSAEYEGKPVTVDVAFVKPIQFKPRGDQFAFFHIVTLDRRDMKPGGRMLVAIPAENAAAFSKKYGMDWERGHTTALEGTLVAGTPKGKGPQRWVLDTTGKLQAALEAKTVELPETDGSGESRGERPRKQ